jgi:hypothetical protein
MSDSDPDRLVVRPPSPTGHVAPKDIENIETALKGLILQAMGPASAKEQNNIPVELGGDATKAVVRILELQASPKTGLLAATAAKMIDWYQGEALCGLIT